MAGEGTLFHAFWWTPYVTFCALAVVYVREIQLKTGGEGSGELSWAQLVNLADGCLSHLAKATAPSSPNRRYSVILEELRVEARHQTLPSGDNHPPGFAPAGQEEGRGESATAGLAESQRLPFGSIDGQTDGRLFVQADDAAFTMSSLLDGWQTSDWLDLDSSVRCSVRFH